MGWGLGFERERGKEKRAGEQESRRAREETVSLL